MTAEQDDGELDDETPTRTSLTPAAVAVEMTDQSSNAGVAGGGDNSASAEAEHQFSIGALTLASKAVARVRARIRHGHHVLARRFGIGLVVISALHVAMLVFVSMRGSGGRLSTTITLAASVSTFIFHVGITLPYDDARLLWVHYGTFAGETIIRGIVGIARGDYSQGVYYLFGWCVILYPLGARGLQRFLRVVRQFDAKTRHHISQSALFAFAAGVPPVLYFCMNGVLCLSFSDDPGQTCGTRVFVNCVTIFALVGNAMMVVMLTIQPISLKQVTHMSIPPLQLAALGLLGLLLMLALVLYSQNEHFGPTTPTVIHMSNASAPCLMLSLIAHCVSIAREGRRNEATVVVAPVGASRHGTMIPYRIVMVAFTIQYIAVVGRSCDGLLNVPINTLSTAAACFHVLFTMEDASVSWPVTLHYIGHASHALIQGGRALRDRDLAGVAQMSFYLFIVYPGTFAAMVQVRASIRAHGDEAAAKFVGKCFYAFWVGIVPPMLYLGADSLGAPLLSLFS